MVQHIYENIPDDAASYPFYKAVVMTQDRWGTTSLAQMVELYSSKDEVTWYSLGFRTYYATESTHMSLVHWLLFRSMYILKMKLMTKYQTDITPDKLIVEFASMSLFLHFSRFIPTYGQNHVKALKNTMRILKQFNPYGNDVEIRLGMLGFRNYSKRNLHKFTYLKSNIEDDGILTTEYIEEESAIRKKFGMWKYGN